MTNIVYSIEVESTEKAREIVDTYAKIIGATQEHDSSFTVGGVIIDWSNVGWGKRGEVDFNGPKEYVETVFANFKNLTGINKEPVTRTSQIYEMPVQMLLV